MRRLLSLLGALAIPAVIVAAVILLAGGSSGGLIVRAYFSDARGLVPGADVRINGAPAGTVTGMRLAANGMALVTMRLSNAPYPPRSDATAAIRPVDLLGDNYVALTLGTGAARLHSAIAASQTVDAPQLADLLNAFRAPERTALGALIVGLGMSLDQRGADLNQATLALRPALAAADGVMTELGSQNADLRQVIGDAEQVTAQAAARDVDLGRSVGSLHRLLALTAAHRPGLSAGLATLPQTLSQLTVTARALRSTSLAATPLAAGLRTAVPPLSSTVSLLPAFLDALRSAAGQLHPALGTAGSVLSAIDPTAFALGTGLGTLAADGSTLGQFANALVPAAPGIAQGFFDNFPNQAAEPGNQPFDPFANPLRHYWRGAAVFSCESFGVPIAPGCLTKYLAAASPTAFRTRSHAAAPHPTRTGGATTQGVPGAAGSAPAPPATLPNAAPIPPLPLPLPSPPNSASAPQAALGHLLSYLLH